MGTGGILGGGVGNGLLGGDGPTKLLQSGGGITGTLLGEDGELLPIGPILNKKVQCIKLCPDTIADTKLPCVKPTTFPTTPVCYGKNAKNKWLFPCQDGDDKPKKKKPKKKKKDEEEDEDEDED